MIDARLWLIQSDGSRYRCARPQPKDVIITHEFWMPTGDRLAYVYRKADDGSTETIRMLRPEPLEEALNMHSLPYAHFICDRQRRWFVGDCQGQETPIHLQPGEGRGQEVRNDFIYLVDIARKKEIPLCYHVTSWTTIRKSTSSLTINYVRSNGQDRGCRRRVTIGATLLELGQELS